MASFVNIHKLKSNFYLFIFLNLKFACLNSLNLLILKSILVINIYTDDKVGQKFNQVK